MLGEVYGYMVLGMQLVEYLPPRHKILDLMPSTA